MPVQFNPKGIESAKLKIKLYKTRFSRNSKLLAENQKILLWSWDGKWPSRASIRGPCWFLHREQWWIWNFRKENTALKVGNSKFQYPKSSFVRTIGRKSLDTQDKLENVAWNLVWMGIWWGAISCTLSSCAHGQKSLLTPNSMRMKSHVHGISHAHGQKWEPVRMESRVYGNLMRGNFVHMDPLWAISCAWIHYGQSLFKVHDRMDRNDSPCELNPVCI